MKPIEQRQFFIYLNDTIDELAAQYGANAKLLSESPIQRITELGQQLDLLPLYHTAIVDNIIFLAGGGDEYKAEFLRKSKTAWLKYWKDNAVGKKILNFF